MKKFKAGSVLLVLVSILVVNANCFNRRRYNNWNWQLDSLKYYTYRFDSLLSQQMIDLAHLRVDIFTKSDELSEKFEMLNSRLSDTETQLTWINEKLGSGKRFYADSLEGGQINPEARLVYEAAYLNYVKGNYSEAVSGFQSYLKMQPDSPLADNALYWIGEALAAMGKRQDAVNTFQELIKQYPQSSRVPTALYKTGIIYDEAGDKKTANLYYNKILKEFPNSPEAILVQDKMKP